MNSRICSKSEKKMEGKFEEYFKKPLLKKLREIKVDAHPRATKVFKQICEEIFIEKEEEDG